MTKRNGWKKMLATLALAGLMLAAPQLVSAGIARDIAAGKHADIAAQEAVKGGMMPVQAALEAVTADPQSAVTVAVAVARENPNAAADIAGALAGAQPEQAMELVRTLSALFPDRTEEIAAAAAKAICGNDKQEKYMADRKQNLLDVCSALDDMIGSANLPATIMRGGGVNAISPGLDIAPIGGGGGGTAPPPGINDSVRPTPSPDNRPASGI